MLGIHRHTYNLKRLSDKFGSKKDDITFSSEIKVNARALAHMSSGALISQFSFLATPVSFGHGEVRVYEIR